MRPSDGERVMAETTNISWSDMTWSPWTGCSKISPGCEGCYAAHLMDTRMHRVEWGELGSGEGTRSLMSDAYWRKPLIWNKQVKAGDLKPFVFPSLCDPFDNAVDQIWYNRFVDLMEATPNLVWLLLTKRIGNVRKFFDAGRGYRLLPNNVALGATFVNQAEYDRDIGKLGDAAELIEPVFTFASYEPLLGGVRQHAYVPDVVIAGGGTDQGPWRAPPSHPDWFRSLRDETLAAGKMFHFKQWGMWREPLSGEEYDTSLGRAGKPPAFIVSTDGSVHCFKGAHIRGQVSMIHVGAKKAGRTLDGVIHDQRPEVRA